MKLNVKKGKINGEKSASSATNGLTVNWPVATMMLCLAFMSAAAAAGKPYFWQILFGKADRQEPASGGGGVGYDKANEAHANWTTIDWISKHNYSCEEYNVTTADGYQLQLQRLPRHGQRPVLLLHGLLMSSLSWVLLGANRSLAFQLYDNGYDVWLGNFRGTRYGRVHNHWNGTQPEFWSFSFHEHGLYDLPKIIDYVREATSFHQLLLIAHSQAFNAFLALSSMRWEYNDRVLLMQALAPPTELRNFVKLKYADMQKVRKFLKRKEKSAEFEVFPEGYLKQKCVKGTANEQKTCVSWLKKVTGVAQFNKSQYASIFGQLLEGGSLKELTHLEQIWQSGDFVQFDYGVGENPRHYNAVQPLGYNLSQVTVPLVLHFGETDALATAAGVHHIYSHLLGGNANVLGVYRVAAAKFNHLDFIYSPQVQALVNDKLIDIMSKYLAGKLQYVIE